MSFNLKKLIQSKPSEWMGACACYPSTQELMDRFTIPLPFEDEDDLLLYEVESASGNLLLPRGVCPNTKLDLRSPGLPIVFTNKIKARNVEQERLFKESVSLLAHGQSFMIEAPTGVGKTIVGLNAIAKLGVKTLIIVTKEDSFYQWRGVPGKTPGAMGFLDLKEEEIGLIGNGKCEIKDKKIVIAMIQSIYKEKFSATLFSDFGFVVWDECHRANADQFKKTVSKFSAKLRLGLSATTKRRDGKDIIFQAHIGPVLVKSTQFSLKPKVVRVLSDWKVPLVRRWDTREEVYKMVKLPHVAGKTMHLIKILAKIPSRNDLICQFIYAAYGKGRFVILFSELREAHLEPIKKILISMGISKKDIAFYIGGLTLAQRQVAVTKRILLATYAMTAEATDIPWFDTAILGTPRAHVEQPIGRILREYPEKKDPVVLDIIDADSPIFKSYGVSRQKWYKSIKAKVV